MTEGRSSIMIVVHPGSACGSADFNLGKDAPAMRGALAREISAWRDDIMIVDGVLSDELPHYALLDVAIVNASDRPGRRLVRHRACDADGAAWPQSAAERFSAEWPGGPHLVMLTGAWAEADGSGCVNAVARAISGHAVTVSTNALSIGA